MTEPGGDYGKRLVRLAALLVRDQAAAEQVIRDVLASSPPQVRDAGAERRAVVIRCRAILRDHEEGAARAQASFMITEDFGARNTENPP